MCGVRSTIDYGQPLFVYAKRTSRESTPSPERVEADIYLVDSNGTVLVEFAGAQVQRLGRSGGASASADTSRWLYQIKWREEPIQTSPGKDTTGKPWLIFADSRGVGRSLADQLGAAGNACILVARGDEFESVAGASENGHPARHGRFLINPLDETHYARLIDEAFVAQKCACAGIVHLWSLDVSDESLTDANAFGCGGVLQLVRATTRSSLQGSSPLWLVTSGRSQLPLRLAVHRRRSLSASRRWSVLDGLPLWNCPICGHGCWI